MRWGLVLAVALIAFGPAARSWAQPAQDEAYDARVRDSFEAAEAFQGPLDGSWTLEWRGKALYHLQLSDHEGKLEGVWSDPRQAPGPFTSGLLEVKERSQRRLWLRFALRDGTPVQIDLSAERDGRWSGRLEEADEIFADVRLQRSSP